MKYWSGTSILKARNDGTWEYGIVKVKNLFVVAEIHKGFGYFAVTKELTKRDMKYLGKCLSRALRA